MSTFSVSIDNVNVRVDSIDRIVERVEHS